MQLQVQYSSCLQNIYYGSEFSVMITAYKFKYILKTHFVQFLSYKRRIHNDTIKRLINEILQ